MKVARGRAGVLGRRRAGSSFVIAFSSFLMLWLITERQNKNQFGEHTRQFLNSGQGDWVKVKIEVKDLSSSKNNCYFSGN